MSCLTQPSRRQTLKPLASYHGAQKDAEGVLLFIFEQGNLGHQSGQVRVFFRELTGQPTFVHSRERLEIFELSPKNFSQRFKRRAAGLETTLLNASQMIGVDGRLLGKLFLRPSLLFPEPKKIFTDCGLSL